MIRKVDFAKARASKRYQNVFRKKNPLVSVCIPTYNRSSLLVNRSLKSVLNQTYKNLEIIVIGDCCTDNTEEVVKSLNDPRILFENLSERGQYPSDPFLRWLVAGSFPSNRALELASGDFITHLDDDDAYKPVRIESLVNFAKKTNADFIFHPFWWEREPNKWFLNNQKELKLGSVTTSSIFYHKWFKRILWDPNCYLSGEPGDWNRVRRIKSLGIKVKRYPAALTEHFHEMTNTND